VVLERGRLIEQGRHQELMALSGTYQQLFSLQADADHAEFDARSP
jgi:ABC-type multidrug transport system fused ATPase/permease subunit